MVKDIIHTYEETPAAVELDNYPTGFEMIADNNASHAGNHVLTLPRRNAHHSGVVAWLVNFSAVPHLDHGVALPLFGVVLLRRGC